VDWYQCENTLKKNNAKINGDRETAAQVASAERLIHEELVGDGENLKIDSSVGVVGTLSSSPTYAGGSGFKAPQ
jgi:hypothetical protein